MFDSGNAVGWELNLKFERLSYLRVIGAHKSVAAWAVVVCILATVTAVWDDCTGTHQTENKNYIFQ